MAKNKNVRCLFSLKDQKAAADKRTKLYRIVNGIKVMPKENKKPPTEAQAKQQLRFGMAITFARQLKQMIDIGFKSKTKVMTGMNFSTKQILQCAIIGEYPAYSIDYAKVIISYGDLLSLRGCTAGITNGTLSLAWRVTTFERDELGEDHLLFVVLYNATQKVCHNYAGAGKRRDLFLNIPFPIYSNDDEYHCWVFVATPDLKKVSPTAYFNLSKSSI